MNHSEKRALTTALDGLKAMLCNPAGEVVITGSLADRQEIASHLGALTYLSNDDAEEAEGVDASAPQVGPTLLDDAILRATEELARLEGHDPQHHVWLDHLRDLLGVQIERLRHPANVITAPAGGYMLHVVGEFADAGSAEPTIHVSDITGKPSPAKDDVVDAEFPPTFIDFKSYPSGSPLRYSCYELVRRVVRNACPGGYNRSVVTYPRWHYVQQATGLGSTYSQQLCQHFGLNPDEQL